MVEVELILRDEPIHDAISGARKQVDNSGSCVKQNVVVSSSVSVKKKTECKVTVVKKYEESSVVDVKKEGSETVLMSERRCSVRIKNIKKDKKDKKEEKMRLVRERVALLNDVNDDGSRKKKPKIDQKRKGNFAIPVEVESSGKEGEVSTNKMVLEFHEASRDGVVECGDPLPGDGEDGVGAGTGADGGVEKSVYARVKETLRMFNTHYLHFVQEEEKRCKKAEPPPKKASSKKPEKGKASISKEPAKQKQAKNGDVKNQAKRPDLKAITKMMETNTILFKKKWFGPIPGIDVGHQFFSRAEMVVIGSHSHWLNGIDYMGQSYAKDYEKYTFPLAVSIVLSGVYEDDLDNSDDVVYTGQGGNNLLGDHKQMSDQVLARGNLALKNSLEQCVPIRVVRGHKCASSYVGKVYTYDGLYKVVQYWAEKGVSGFTVFKYRLRRLEGQPVLTTNQVLYGNGRAPRCASEIRGLVCADISGGQENVPIPATNLVDDPPVAPEGYTYIKSMEVSRNVKFPACVGGCDCSGNCMDSRTCSCAKRNGGDLPYVQRDGGRLIEAKDVVFECGPKCGCGPGCVNRTSQKGLKYRFEVFKTPKKGWAVRSWDFIPSGAPICEYIGKLIKSDDLGNILDDKYIFDIDCLQTMKGLDGRERRSKATTLDSTNFLGSDDQKHDEAQFCIDACSTGNIARFFNHSCEPNLFIQCVLSSHHDVKLARVMLFAADNIPPMQELTYDYGYVLDSVLGPDGKIKVMPCYCGAAGCRQRLF